MKFEKMNWRAAAMAFMDMLLVALSGGLALLLRFDFAFESPDYLYFQPSWLKAVPVYVLVTVSVFLIFRMYRFVWRYISAIDVMDMFIPIALSFAISTVITLLMKLRMPISVYVVWAILEIILLIGVRTVIRFVTAYRSEHLSANTPNTDRIMIIGAGDAGNTLLREFKMSSRTLGRVVCFIDDNLELLNKRIEGVPIVGNRNDIKEAVAHYGVNQIIFAIPAATPVQKKEILNICKDTGCRLRVVPGLYQLVNGSVSISVVKDVEIADLLGREPVTLDTDCLDNFIRGKVVMVTGGGGSIGSELCRQIAPYSPKQLIILDIYENNAYYIQQELIRKYADSLNLTVEIASVRDKDKIDLLFDRYRPDIVFHAAAHKHVPLMENNPDEAIKNNVFGTFNVASAADRYGVSKFVLISTDKAVNPTNLMGASKRLCEMILNSFSGSQTSYSSVRFGNVLGSNGSVVPLFKQQIAAGGPVTITDKRITRFFMTGEEATQLVLTCGAIAGRNQVFVLDMGEPVKILSMAENLIRLSGLEPYVDIDIKEIGLRPGEKLYEELLMDTADLETTVNRKIFVEQQGEIAPEVMVERLASLRNALDSRKSNDELIALMKTLVPTYKSPDEVNRKETM